MPEAGKSEPASPVLLRIFLLFHTPEVAELLRFSLDSFFHCEVRSFPSSEEMLAAASAGAPQLLVIDGLREDAAMALEAAKSLGVKVAFYHQNKQKPSLQGLDLAGVFNEPELLPGISAILKLLGAEARNPTTAEGNPSYPYFRVGIPLLLRTNPLVADIYVRLSELKYLKLFHKGAPFGAEEVKKYHETKKIEFFYVKQENAEVITAKLNETMEDLLKQDSLPQAVSTPASLTAIETIHSLVNLVGFTDEVQRLVQNSVALVIKEMLTSPTLASILKNMALEKNKYIASHSHMLAEVACALSIGMKWDSDTSFKKLTMAALLHDMSLSNQKLAQVKNLKELTERKSEFSPSDAEEYRSHSRRASVLVQGMKEVPADVDKIILQHHELPTGMGFPDGLNHVHIHPLASLLMVAHDLVDWVIDHPGPEPDIEAFIEAHMDKYKMGNFRKILKAIYSLQV